MFPCDMTKMVCGWCPMSECFFIGGPLDEERLQVDDGVTTFKTPEISFTWTDINGIPADVATIQRWVHQYERHPESLDTFVYDGKRRRERR